MQTLGWRQIHVISRLDKGTRKKTNLWSIFSWIRRVKPFWLDFEYGVLEWKANDTKQIFDEEVMIRYKAYELEERKGQQKLKIKYLNNGLRIDTK